ncbi:MAG: hypothetical protein RIQ77_321 [Pseudomonadota bacterium]
MQYNDANRDLRSASIGTQLLLLTETILSTGRYNSHSDILNQISRFS